MKTALAHNQAAETYGTVTEAGSIMFERLLPGPIERVWEYLTDPDKRATWLAAGPMDLRPGGKVALHFRNSDLSPTKEPVPARFKGMEAGVTLQCEVTACRKPHRLSFLWGSDGSEVTFELAPQGTEVLLTLTHRRLPNRADMLMVAGGWHTHLGLLLDQFAQVSPRPFWSNFLTLEAEYETRVPKP
jgi:uncharacterized protein YndB with AHSA1/START domain